MYIRSMFQESHSPIVAVLQRLAESGAPALHALHGGDHRVGVPAVGDAIHHDVDLPAFRVVAAYGAMR